VKAKKLLVFVDILLIGLVLWLGTDIVMGWKSPGQNGPAAASDKEAKEMQQRSGGVGMKNIRNYYYIITQDVFDTEQKTTAPAPPAKKVEATRLPLRLKGTVVGKDRKSYAVIQEGNSDKEKLCSVNDVVQNARIVKIESDVIILDVNGKEEALHISYEKKNRPVPARVSRRRPRATRVRPRVSRSPRVPPAKPTPSVKGSPQPTNVFKPASGQ
jgi:type II secretory pathway component PulC